jgi:hypothetical protein
MLRGCADEILAKNNLKFRLPIVIYRGGGGSVSNQKMQSGWNLLNGGEKDRYKIASVAKY